jgi:hypothetical protein
MSTSADLGISYIAGQQAQPEITHNTALNQIQILQTGVISVALNTPPGSPAQGDTYILGASPTGAWAGRANCLAGYFGTGWVFVPGNDSSGTAITMGVRHEGLKVYSKADNALYVWNGTAWAAVTTGMTNPMTTSQDLIVGGASGTPVRLAIGTNGYVLTAVAGAVAWAVATGFANPMTSSGDIIYGGASGVATRLAAGTNGHVLTLAGGVPSWAANAGMVNPMTASGDVIYGGASGVPTRLAAGTNGYVLTLTAGVPTWAAAAAGMTNPMTTSGDIIYGGASGTPTRLAAGSNGQVLTLAAGVPSWAAASGGGTGSIAAAIISGNDYPFYMGSSSGAFNYSAVVNSTVRTSFSLVQLESSLTFDHIVLAVRTVLAGSSMDIGIYPFTGAGKLGACLSSANIPTTATGRISVSVTPVTLPAGLYYVAWHASSTTPACVGLNQASGFYQTPLAAVSISDAMTRLGAGTTTLASVLMNDSSLPGGSYTRGMDLSALTLSSAGIVGYDTIVPCVGLTKQ